LQYVYENKLCVNIMLQHNKGQQHVSSETLPHMHKFFEILILLSGKAGCFIEKNIYTLKPGQLIVISSEEIHKLTVDDVENCESIEILFDPADPYFSYLGITDLFHCFINRPKGERNRIPLSKAQADHILDLINKIEYYTNNIGYGFSALRVTSFIELLVYINSVFINITHQENSSTLPEVLINIMDYVDNNLSSDLSLEFLVNKFYVDKYYLCRIFRKYTGFNLHKYIILKRVLKAKSLLQEGLSVTDACHTSGFNDYSNFVRTFKKVTNTSPLQYSKKYSGKSSMPDNYPFNDIFLKHYPSSFGLPDLVVRDILWSPENPVEGDIVSFSAVIENIGTGSTPAGIITGVGFSIGKPTYCWSDNYILPLAPGESVTLTANGGHGGIPAWHATTGTHKITAFVDDVCRIKEITRENNKLIKTLTVAGR